MASGLKVIAPATISHLNCGFEVLGLSTDLIADEVVGRRSDAPGVRILQITGAGKKGISQDPAYNTAGKALQNFFNYTKISNAGIELEIHKPIPGGTGLGSGASSACAAVVLANALFETHLLQKELIALAISGEYISSRTYHSCNVTPCIMGGMILTRDMLQLDFQRLHVPKGIFVVIVRPNVIIPKTHSRDGLSKKVLLTKSIKQSANLASLILGLERGDLKLISDSMQDHLIEDQRAQLVPEYYNVRDAAFQANALAFGISGSGPTLFAIAQNTTAAENIGIQITRVFADAGIESNFHVSPISHEGARLL